MYILITLIALFSYSLSVLTPAEIDFLSTVFSQQFPSENNQSPSTYKFPPVFKSLVDAPVNVNLISYTTGITGFGFFAYEEQLETGKVLLISESNSFSTSVGSGAEYVHSLSGDVKYGVFVVAFGQKYYSISELNTINEKHFAAVYDSDSASAYIGFTSSSNTFTDLWILLKFTAGIETNTQSICRPPTPRGLKVSDVQPTSATICWEQAYENCCSIEKYSIYLECSDLPSGWGFVDSVSSLCKTVYGLSPGTAYKVGLSSSNCDGESHIISVDLKTKTSCNILSNPDFTTVNSVGTAYANWFGSSYIVQDNVLRLSTDTSNLSKQVSQGFEYTQESLSALELMVVSKAENMDLSSAAYVQVTMKYNDDTYDYDNNLYLSSETSSDFIVSTMTVSPKKPLAFIYVVIVLNGLGVIIIDNISLCPSNSILLSTCVSYGDPHLVTFDGLKYDNHRVGEFWLVKSDEDQETKIDVQVRQVKTGNNYAMNGGVAIKVEVNGVSEIVSVIAGDVGMEPKIYYNSALISSESIDMPLVNGASFHKSGTMSDNEEVVVSVQHPNGGKVNVRVLRSSWLVSYIQVEVLLATIASKSKVKGLCGFFDGDLTNDFTSSDDNIVTVDSPSYTELYSTFTDSWLVGDQSFFTYEETESTDAFYDALYPSRILTIQEFDAILVETAVLICKNTGVIEPKTLEACALDIVSTGDPSIAKGSLGVTKGEKQCGKLNAKNDNGKTMVCVRHHNHKASKQYTPQNVKVTDLDSLEWIPFYGIGYDGNTYDCACNVVKDSIVKDNLAKNGDFSIVENGLVKDWTGFIDGYTTASSGIVTIVSSDTSRQNGIYQYITLDQQVATALKVKASSRSTQAETTDGSNYSCYIDMRYIDGEWDTVIAEFSQGTHDWEEVEFTVSPKKPIRDMTVHLLFRYATGIAHFSGVHIETTVTEDLQYPHILRNTGFQKRAYRSNEPLASWTVYGNGYTTIEGEKVLLGDNLNRVLVLTNENTETTSGARQLIEFKTPTTRGFKLMLKARSFGISGNPDIGCGIYMDILHDDDTYTYGESLILNTGTTDWTFSQKIFLYSKAVKSINFYVLLRGHTGTLMLDDVDLVYASTSDLEEYANKNMGSPPNPSFEYLSNLGQPEHWTMKNCKVSDEESLSGSKSIKCQSTADTESYVKTEFKINQEENLPISITSWSYAVDVLLPASYTFSSYADILYNDGSWSYGKIINFDPTLNKQWQESTLTFTPEKPVATIFYYLFLKNREGVCYFDSVSITQVAPFVIKHEDSTPLFDVASATPDEARVAYEVARLKVEGGFKDGLFISGNDDLLQSYTEAVELYKLALANNDSTGLAASVEKFGVTASDTAFWGLDINTINIVSYPKTSKTAALAFEDLFPFRGDADYNDFVADIHCDELFNSVGLVSIDCSFHTRARGAGYDHALRIRIPTKGFASGVTAISKVFTQTGELKYKTVIDKANQAMNDEEYFDIEIFPSTKEALPWGNHMPDGSNFVRVQQPFRGQFRILIKNPAMHPNGLLNDVAVPFDPYIFVHNTKQEVHIYDIVKDLKYGWDLSGIFYPHGLIVPVDNWKYPLERIDILSIYPTFGYIDSEDGMTKVPQDDDWVSNIQHETPHLRYNPAYFRPKL